MNPPPISTSIKPFSHLPLARSSLNSIPISLGLGFPMKKGKKVEPNGGEISLPESIVQDIQCRLSRKEAAQTTVLSKFWYKAWSTRPDIDLDLGHIRRRRVFKILVALFPEYPSILFSKYARRIMRRYDELNLKIKTFRLCIDDAEHADMLLARELIVKAMQLGAEDIDVGFISQRPSSRFSIILPHEVHGSENLGRLSVSGCVFESEADEGINWPNLKFLCLFQVYIKGDLLRDIMMRCPLVEKLELNKCEFTSGYCSQFLHYGFRQQNFVNNSLNAFNQLKCLMLSFVKIGPQFFCDFSFKFPFLKDLTLFHSLGPKKIHICSHSLESINIDQTIMLRARIDVLSLHKFSLSSCHIPSVTFGTVSGEWESFISATCSSCFNNKWFGHFKKFLTAMSPSKLYLSLNLTPSTRDNLNVAVGHKCVPVLEDLMVNVSAFETQLFWDSLFCSCRPKLITTKCSSIHDMGALEIAYRRLINVGDDCYSANKGMLGQYDLDEVNVEVFDDIAAEWKPASWKKLLDASTSEETKREIRFHLRWDK